MGRRAKRALGDRRKWTVDLAHVVRAGYPQRPADRPRELAEFIAACEIFRHAMRDPDGPPKVKVWMAAPTEMGPKPWPVPDIGDLAVLATWLGVTPGHLHWFADRRSMERTVGDEALRHYSRHWMRKPDGSARLLEAPKIELKDLQRQVLHQVLDIIPAHRNAHGFRPGRSVRTAAAQHHRQAVVMRLDLETFFSSIDVGRVYGIFRLAGYPENVAHTLAGLCTTVTPPAVLRAAPDVPNALVDTRRRMLHRLRSPHLAQGSPTSPALANLVAFRLDRRMSGLADTLGARYTRYADDLILSGSRHLVRSSRSIVRLVEAIAIDEGFTVHPLKTRVFTAAQRQTVTGLVVNDRSNMARPDYDKLRAILHHAAIDGPDVANRERHPDFRSHLLGRIAWAAAENPRRAAKLQQAFATIDW